MITFVIQEGTLLVALVVAFPRHIREEHPHLRKAAIAITALVSAANVTSLVLLARLLIQHGSPKGRQLIGAGAAICSTGSNQVGPAVRRSGNNN